MDIDEAAVERDFFEGLLTSREIANKHNMPYERVGELLTEIFKKRSNKTIDKTFDGIYTRHNIAGDLQRLYRDGSISSYTLTKFGLTPYVK